MRKFTPSNVVHAPTSKHHGENMNILPPSLYPCEPYDTADQRLLDLNEAAIPNPLSKHLGIEGYNLHWFDPAIKSSTPNITPNQAITHTSPSTSKNIPVAPTTLSALFSAIDASKDKLFFISHQNAGTLRPIWYLITVDWEQTLNPSADLRLKTDGLYYCHFLHHPKADSSLPDPLKRWWPIWHKYTTDVSGIVTYGIQVEFPPSQTPPAQHYIAWAAPLCLVDSTVNLVGPFDFQPPSSNQIGRTATCSQVVPCQYWATLNEHCISYGIKPPCMADTTPVLRRSKRKHAATFHPNL